MNYLSGSTPSSGQKNLMSVSLVLVQKTTNGIGTVLNFNKKLFFSPPFSLWWWVGPACREWNEHQPPRSSFVSKTVLFSHEWQTCY